MVNGLETTLSPFRNICDQLDFIVWISDIESGSTLYLNPAYESIYNRKSRAIYEGTETFYDQVHPDDLGILQRRPAVDSRYYDYRILLPDNGLKWIREKSISPVTVNGWAWKLVVAREISDQVSVYNDLYESEMSLRAVLNATADPIVLLDAKGRVVLANDVVSKRLGTDPSALFGAPIADFFPPEVARLRKEKFAQVLNTKKPVFFEDERLGRWMENHLYPVFDSQNNVVRVAAYSHDFTQRKNYADVLKKKEAELKRKNLRLDKLNTALKVLLTIKSRHEKEMEFRIITNMEKLILPYLEKIKRCKLDTQTAGYISLLESSLHNITSSLSHDVLHHHHLTPRELEIAMLIKQGKSNKEIAELLNLSVRTIECHRQKIREIFGLKKKKVNLKSHLQTMFDAQLNIRD